MLFSSKANLEILEEARNWVIDGTFNVAPKLVAVEGSDNVEGSDDVDGSGDVEGSGSTEGPRGAFRFQLRVGYRLQLLLLLSSAAGGVR